MVALAVINPGFCKSTQNWKTWVFHSIARVLEVPRFQFLPALGRGTCISFSATGVCLQLSLLTLHLILYVHTKFFHFAGWCCATRLFHTLLLWRWRFCSLEWCFRRVGSCGGLPVLFSPHVLAAGQFWAFPALPQIFYCIPVESLLASLVSPSPLTPDGLKSGQVLFHGLLGACSSCTSSWVFDFFFQSWVLHHKPLNFYNNSDFTLIQWHQTTSSLNWCLPNIGLQFSSFISTFECCEGWIMNVE
jgi:hypothetical protein